MLMEGRDKKKYRNKGARQTTVKTVYGEVTYQRTVYEVTEEDGTRHFVYLLDETLELDHVGLISTNMAELLVKGITELSYRECARQVSEMTGQTISAMGVWNVIQALGEKVCEDEAELTEAYKKGQVKGKREVPVLFEEADGVYIKLQGKDRKKEKQDKSEIKIGIAYDGWRKTGPDRYALENKVVVAGFSKAKEFQEYREGLLPYQSQELELPDPPEGLEYRNMGTMENHVWSVIAKRMKHGHRSWSRRGGNHLAKILAKKCSGKLYEVTERLRRPVFEEEKVEELYGEILMSAKTPKKDGKGYQYPAVGHVVGLEGKIQGERKRLLYMAGY